MKAALMSTFFVAPLADVGALLRNQSFHWNLTGSKKAKRANKAKNLSLLALFALFAFFASLAISPQSPI